MPLFIQWSHLTNTFANTHILIISKFLANINEEN